MAYISPLLFLGFYCGFKANNWIFINLVAGNYRLPLPQTEKTEFGIQHGGIVDIKCDFYKLQAFY
jgi:hypothetical protein